MERTLKTYGGFPVASVVTDVRAVAKPIDAYTFGLDKDGLARALRDLADAVERGTINPQKAEVLQTATIEDFTLSEFRLTYALKSAPDAPKP